MKTIRKWIIPLIALPTVLALGVLALPHAALAACNVTNTFVIDTTAVADQVNTNFSDLTTCIETLQGDVTNLQGEVAALQALTQPSTGDGILILPVGISATPGDWVRGTIDANGSSFYRFIPDTTGTMNTALTDMQSNLNWELFSNNDFTGSMTICNFYGSTEDEICTTLPLTSNIVYYLRINELGGTAGDYVIAPAGLSDLTITIDSVSEMTCIINVSVTIYNSGDVDPGNVNLSIWLNRASAPSVGDTDYDWASSVSSIPAGGNTTHTFWPNSCVATGTAYAIVDYSDSIPELDDVTNNVSAEFPW